VVRQFKLAPDAITPSNRSVASVSEANATFGGRGMKPITMVWICLVLAVGLPGLASAANTESFVSGSGDDSAACTRDAPCLTFQSAHDKTAAGGQISCLDAADYGPVRITKAISIVCDGPRGTIGQPNEDAAVFIQVGAGDAVSLSGLDLQGEGVAWWGVLIESAGSVVIRNSTMDGFAGFFSDGGAGFGIGVFSSTALRLDVIDVRVSNNYEGVVIGPQYNVPLSRISLSHVQAAGNASHGVEVQGWYATGPVELAIRDSVSIGNGKSGIQVTTVGPNSYPPNPSGQVLATITRTVISGNLDAGVGAFGPTTRVRIGDSVITNNSHYGLSGSSSDSSALESYGDNQIANNLWGDTIYTSTIPRQ
jgi:hypothetical protein